MAVLEILLFLSFYGKYGAGEHYDNWNWLWVCNIKEGRCVRSAEPVNNFETDFSSSSQYYNSLSVCRLTCGRHGALWPKPTISTTLEHQLVEVHPDNFYFDTLTEDEDVRRYIQENALIFRENLHKECGGTCTETSETKVIVYISIKSTYFSLTWSTNESYSLEVSNKGNPVAVEISAETVYGARHALETLSQLMASYQLLSKQEKSDKYGLVMVGAARIKDRPVYPHRGLLLDTARNFLTLESIKRQLDAMAASKLNVLHWHATDSQSFPLESKRVPHLSKYGAYSQDNVYSAQQIEEVIRYARIRGVRVIIEIDTPAHAGNGWQWGNELGLGDLAVCVNQQPWRSYCIQPPCGQLNPVNKNVYKVLGDLYRDLLDLLPQNEVFHMGGDEVFIPCWNSSQEIIEYLKAQGKGTTTEDFLDLWGEFHDVSLRVFDAKVGHDRTPVMLWSSQLTQPEVIQKYLPPNRYVIQTWVPASNDLPQKLLDLGYHLVISTKDAWYLDHGFWGSTKYHTWRSAYQNLLPKSSKVLGGEACMWGEYVEGGSVDGRVWPRTAAVAERLWSDPPPDSAAAESRFYRHRERLVSRGIQAEALAPRWCVQNEGECK